MIEEANQNTSSTALSHSAYYLFPSLSHQNASLSYKAHPQTYVHADRYPKWLGQISFFSSSNGDIHFQGPSLEIHTAEQLHKYKEQLDWFKFDLNSQNYKFKKTGVIYHKDIYDLINGYTYLLVCAFACGHENPTAYQLQRFEYKKTIKAIWRNFLDALRMYERDNQDNKDFRKNTVNRLYQPIAHSKLNEHSVWYKNFTSDILRAEKISI